MSGEIEDITAWRAGQEIGELSGDGGHIIRLLEPQLFGETHLTDSAATFAPIVNVDTPAVSMTEMFTVSLSPRRKSLDGTAPDGFPGNGLEALRLQPLGVEGQHIGGRRGDAADECHGCRHRGLVEAAGDDLRSGHQRQELLREPGDQGADRG